MIAICIIGVLASVAIPAYSRFMMNAKFGEVEIMNGTLYKAMAAYWESPFASGRGTVATAASHCVLGDDGGGGGVLMIPPFPPRPEKRLADWTAAPHLASQGMGASGGYVYGSYTWVPRLFGGQCGLSEADYAGAGVAGGPVVYTIVGATDLDGDGQLGGAGTLIAVRGEQLYRVAGQLSIAEGMAYFGAGGCPFCAAGMVD